MNTENNENIPQGLPTDIPPPLSPAEVRRIEGMRNSPNPMLGSVRAADLGNALPGAVLKAAGPRVIVDTSQWTPEEFAELAAAAAKPHAFSTIANSHAFNTIISSVVQANMQALAERERAGRAEHGADMDRQDYSARQWLEELIAENLDSANYGRKLLEMLPRLEAAANMLVLMGYAYRDGAWELPGELPDAATMSPGIAGIIAERARQVAVEGWTPEHDDCHRGGALALAAACYARHAGLSDFQRETIVRQGITPPHWPWALNWWKPKDRRRDLIRAGALIVAELERLDRAEAKGGAA